MKYYLCIWRINVFNFIYIFFGIIFIIFSISEILKSFLRNSFYILKKLNKLLIQKIILINYKKLNTKKKLKNKINYNLKKKKMNYQNYYNYPPSENGSPSYQTSYRQSNTPTSSRIQSSNTSKTNNYSNFPSSNEIQNFKILKRIPQTPINQNYQSSNQLNQFNYYSNPRTIDDNINEQIAKLRNDVNRQYMEMSNLLGKLKMDVVEANQMRNEAERELQYIREEVMKTKMNKILYENKLGKVLEKYAPYNNLHINVRETDPLYSLQNMRKDLKSQSDLIYSTDMINEGNANRVRQLSALAQVGQSLVGESEFIPINENNNNNGYYNNFNNNSIRNNGYSKFNNFNGNNINGNNSNLNNNVDENSNNNNINNNNNNLDTNSFGKGNSNIDNNVENNENNNNNEIVEEN